MSGPLNPDHTPDGRPVWTDRDGWHVQGIRGAYPTREAAIAQIDGPNDHFPGTGRRQHLEEHMTEPEPVSGELVRYEPATEVSRVDMRDRITDSWTDVLTDVIKLASGIAETEFVPEGLRTREKTTAAIMYSREIGLAPMTGLSSIHMIKGRVGLSAEAMRGLIMQAGHQFRIVDSSSARCQVKCRRRDWAADDWSTFTYTFNEAQQAGDVQRNPTYKTRPADMLVARATTRAARAVFPDVIHGLRSVEELQDMSEEVVRVVQGDAGPAATSGGTVQRRGGRGRVVEGEAGDAGDASAPGGKGKPDEGEISPASPPARKRAPEPATRGTASEPPADDIEAQQAEIRRLADEKRALDQDQPAPDQQPSKAAEAEPGHEFDEVTKLFDLDQPAMISAAQRAAMMARFNQLGIGKARDEYLMLAATIVGRGIGSTNELTHAEARRVLTAMDGKDTVEAVLAEVES